MGKCVLNNLPIDTEEIRNWINENCEQLVANAEAINNGLISLEHHRTPSMSDSEYSGPGFMHILENDYWHASSAAGVYPTLGSGTKPKFADRFSDWLAAKPDVIEMKDQASLAKAMEQALNKVDWADSGDKGLDYALEKLHESLTAHSGGADRDLRDAWAQGEHSFPGGLPNGTTFEQWEASKENFASWLEYTRDSVKAQMALAAEYEKLVQDHGLKLVSELDQIENEIAKCMMGKDGVLGYVKFTDTIVKTREECITEEQKQKIKDLKAGIETTLEEVGKPGAGIGAAIAASQEPTKRTFKEQCLLLSNIMHFVEYRNENIWPHEKKRLPYVSYNSGGTSGGGPVDDVPEQAAIKANACLMAERSPWGFMNQLVQDPKFAELFGIQSHLLAQLQPMIRLYKVTAFADGDEIETEINFDSTYNPSLDGVLSSTNKRGFGVGIQNFVFSYEGSDPFAVKKSIKAKLSIFASSLDDLIRPRPASNPKSPMYRYADLALKTGSKTFSKGGSGQACGNRSEVAPNETIDFNYRLKAVVGWAVPSSFKGVTRSNANIIHDAINNSYVTLNLTPTIHEFDINDQGHVVFHINYLAYIEQFFDEASFNIFSNPDTHKSAFVRKQVYKALREDCGDGEGAKKKLKELQESDAETIDTEKRASLNAILQKLLEREQVYMKGIPTEALNQFNSQGPYWKFDLYSKIEGADGGVTIAEKDKVAKENAEIVEANEEGKPPKKDGKGEDLKKAKVSDINEKTYISFFYLSDLVDVILEKIDNTLQALSKEQLKDMPKEVNKSKWDAAVKLEKERLKRVHYNYTKFRILLGPMELIDTVSRDYIETTLGDIPISTAYFMDWLTDKTLKRDSTVYSLPIFIKDLMNNLVKNFLNEDRCFDLNIKQRVRVFQSTVTSYKNPNWGKLKKRKNIDEITEWIYQQSGGSKPRLDMTNMPRGTDGHSSTPVLHVMGERNLPINSRGPESTYNYMVFYAGRVQPQVLMNGDAGEDAGAGIFHYILGRDKGLIKTIRLNKTDAPGLKEVRFEQEGYDGLSQLREVYDANITCYGMPNVVPGTYIYIDPRGFAPDTEAFEGYLDADGNVLNNASLTRLGIGGYYMVTHAENKFGPGNCETEITAKWVAALSCTKTKANYTGPQKLMPMKCGT